MKYLFSNRQILSQVIILVTSNILVTATTLFIIYNQSFLNHQKNLIDIVNRHNTLITNLITENITEKEILHSLEKNHTIGKLGEFTIAIQRNDSIVFLLANGKNPNFAFNHTNNLGTPMRLALGNQTGFVKGVDYYGDPVYAAYTYNPELKWGVVAKIPVAEINQPYIIAAGLALAISIFLVLIWIFLFRKVSTPLIKKIIDSEEHYRSLFDKNQVSMLVIDPENLKIRDANQAACKFYGYSHGKFTSLYLTELTSLPYIELLNLYSQSQPIEKAGTIFKHKLSDGTLRDIEVSNGWIRIHNKRFIYSIIYDISPRLEIEQKLKESEELYRTLFKSINDGVLVSTLNRDGKVGQFIQVNDIICKRLGYTREELLSKTPTDIHSPEMKKWGCEIIEILKKKKQAIFEIEHLTKEGKIIPVEISTKLTEFKDKTLIHSIVRDITERKQLEEKLKQNLNLMRNTQTLAKIGGWEWNLTNNTMFWTEETYLIHEMNSHEIQPGAQDHIARSAMCYQPDDREIILNAFNDCVNTGKPYDLEFPFVTCKGKNLWVRTAAQAEWKDGKICKVIGNISDITQQKETEFALKEKSEVIKNQNEKYRQINEELVLAKTHAEENENRIRTIIDNMFEGYQILDFSWKYLYINQAAEKQNQRPKDELLGKKYQECWPGITETHIFKLLKDSMENRNYNHTENEFIFPNGDKGWFDISIQPIKDGVFILSNDITERKIAEHQLISEKIRAEENEKKYKLIVDNISDVLWVFNLDLYRFTYISPSIFQLRGYTVDEALAQDLNQSLTEASAQNVTELISYRLRQFKEHPEKENFYFDEIQQPCKNGNIIWVETATRFQNNMNSEIEIVGVSRNIDDRKRSEQELLLAKLKAEENDRLKTAFLQNMSHELRTPMNAIMGFADLLADNFNNKKKLESFSEIINQRCNDLLTLINEILDIAKIESGQLTVQNEEFLLKGLFSEIEHLFNDYRLKLKKEHIGFEIDIQELPPLYLIKTDKIKLKQIFINLIGNAFKFTETGQIKAGCYFDKEQNLVCYVSDTGIGIPKSKHQFIFERFTQLNQNNKQKYGGTGLGLSIVKGLVELLKGTIWLISNENQGSTFYFTFSYKMVQNLSIPIAAQNNEIVPNLTGCHVMVVEDDTFNATFLLEMLSLAGINVSLAVTAQEAIILANENSFDFILMDINLPDMNGYDATHIILMKNPHMRIIAQTAYAAPTDRQKALDAGCVDYISKPINRTKLLSMMTNYLVKN